MCLCGRDDYTCSYHFQVFLLEQGYTRIEAAELNFFEQRRWRAVDGRMVRVEEIPT